MADGTSGAERLPRVIRETQHFGTIVVVGGGCYGGYYVRQLHRAATAGAVTWTSLVVVDRDAGCQVALLPAESRPDALEVRTSPWSEYFADYLGDVAANPSDHAADAVVPSPLMPHLMADWLLARARSRWPDRSVSVEPLETAPAVPWQSTGADGTHYVSFAEWICPINCIEPARCPATKGDRSWSLPPSLVAYVASERSAGRSLDGPFVFHCSHRSHGVGMIDVKDVAAADAAIAERGALGPASFLVGTASHCHGALQRIVLAG